MRLFIAANLPDDVREAIEDNLADLESSNMPGKLVSSENIHVTLAFLGEQDEQTTGNIEKAMTKTAEVIEAFDVALGDYGLFGSGAKATLWQGFEDTIEIEALAKELRANLADEQVAFDEKEFKPHITLARKADVDITELEEPWVGEGEIRAMSLIESTLTPQGAEYRTLKTMELRRPFVHPEGSVLIIDADACPVTREAIDEARWCRMPVILVGNGTQNLAKHLKKNDPREPQEGFFAKTFTVLGGDDAADFKIATLVKAGDIVVTQDIGVAAMALGAEAGAIGVRGREYTKSTIDAALLVRHEEKKVRRQGGRTQGPSAFTDEDRRRFRETLKRMMRERRK